ncbi:hypothetical protein PV10_04638 [Exophiala mesophila]|uniref:Major facilitator superfamily (MFS) profile domain-containing protein n=1 Tax=Exophiala mesophila TaxID=212818 RepID=A0A0D1WVN6_EXOME|nr:uncharacterized protein PV10_04638 [Exophiala mesophila]KIV93425.1 hypothetical protein PV10_04638 [Exophiala mesophila]
MQQTEVVNRTTYVRDTNTDGDVMPDDMEKHTHHEQREDDHDHDDESEKGKGTVVTNTHTDRGLVAYQQALELEPAQLEELAKRVRWKLDLILLPLMCAIYLVSFLEKLALNYANAYSLQSDLNLQGRDFAWAAAIVNVGIMVGSYPASLAVQKLPIGRMMSVMLFVWGALSMCTAATKSIGPLLGVRFLLGFAEATVGPAWVILTSMFWTRDEQPLRMCCWLGSNGIAQLLGAGLSVGLGSVTDGAVRPWQLIFLVIGSLAVLLGVVSMFLLPSSPMDARFLTPQERIVCVWRVSSNQIGIKHEKFLKYQVWEAVRDVRVWCLVVQQFTIGFINGAVSNYFSAFLKGFGWSSMDAVKYQLPFGAIQLTSTIFFGWLASRFRNTTFIIILTVPIFPIGAFIGWSTIPNEYKLALTAMTWILALQSAGLILNWTVIAANFAGHTKRTTVNGINFFCFYAGNFAGPFVFDPKEAPRYRTATKILGGILGLMWVATAVMGAVMWRINRRRDAKAAAGNAAYNPAQGELEGFTDRTDKENKSFRYRL